MPGGSEAHFAGYAPVLDAVCSYALEGDDLNPQARVTQLVSENPVALIAEIASTILLREQSKVISQLAAESILLSDADSKTLYKPDEQLGRLASVIAGAPSPPMPQISDPVLQRAYARMVDDFAPQHPFLDSRGMASNATFAAVVLVWSLTSGYAPEAARRTLASRPTLGAGLVFDLYMHWLRGNSAGNDSLSQLRLADVGLLYVALAAQAAQGQQPSLEIIGEDTDIFVSVEFEMLGSEINHGISATYGPFNIVPDAILEMPSPMSNVRVLAPVVMTIGNGSSVSLAAPVMIEVDQLEVDAEELRIFAPAATSAADQQIVSLAAQQMSANRLDRITVFSGKLSVVSPERLSHPWSHYTSSAPTSPTEQIALLRRRLRRILTAFRSQKKGPLKRLAAKIDHARMMKRDDIGPNLLARLKEDQIITTSDADRFYILKSDVMADFLGMDYQAIQQQRWSLKADNYMAQVSDSSVPS